MSFRMAQSIRIDATVNGVRHISSATNFNGGVGEQISSTAAESSMINDAEEVVQEVLGNKMAALELNEGTNGHSEKLIHGYGDGSDSGVDIANCLSVGLQRALSSNSGGYASSNGGLDEPIGLNGNLSCNSSMISYCSDGGVVGGDMSKSPSHSAGISGGQMNSNYECNSENGSESSSVTGVPAVSRPKQSGLRKKVTVSGESSVPRSLLAKKLSTTEQYSHQQQPQSLSLSTAGQLMHNGKPSQSVSLIATPTSGTKRSSSLHRTQSLTRPSMPVLQTRERARSRDKGSSAGVSSSSSKAATPPNKTTPIRSRPPKPDSLPGTLMSTSPSLNRFVQRTPSLTRGSRTPGTPSDDGRWPSVGGRTGVSISNLSKLQQNQSRSGSANPEFSSIKSRVSLMTMDNLKSYAATSNIYATLPRRKKLKSVEDLTFNSIGRTSRSSSASRDKMTSSVILPGKKTNLQSPQPHSYRETTPSKILPPHPTARPRKPAVKTKIYHETSCQTVVTAQDVDNAFSGSAKSIKVDAVEMKSKGTQSDIRDKEMQALRDKLQQATQSKNEIQARLEEKSKKLINMEIQLNKEREEKLAVQKELNLNTERVVGMLELARGTPTEEQGYDSLLMLESQIQMSGHELHEKQEEINKLRRVCRTLQNEVHRSLSAQECLMNEKVNLERESNELQEFLQNEKAALCDALKESECDLQAIRKRLKDKEEEVKVLRDECRHLVRLNEQRRQENKAMQSKYAALEIRTKELSSQKTSAVSGASMALSGLNSRLDSLVEQLISSYNISEQDLEDVVFHNEAYPNSGSSFDGSPESELNNKNNGYTNGNINSMNGNLNTSINCCELNGKHQHHATSSHNHHQQQSQQLSVDQNDGSLSPQRNQSFIAAVISAIRSATMSTSSVNKKIHRSHRAKIHNPDTTQNGEESDSTEMLDSETEPCLMMDNVLEDVTMPDSHSHNMVSSAIVSQMDGVPSTAAPAPLPALPPPSSDLMHGDESLQNLSQAITNRQQIEMQINTAMVAQKFNQCKHQPDLSMSEDISCHDSVAEMPSISEYCSAQALVDQVIEVDNLVTKLLKVLRLIQMDNDSCIQQLIIDKNKLQLNKEEMLEKMKDIEDINIKLRDELMDATQELMMQGNDLSTSKAEIQRHRNEIDRLNEDICNLSQLLNKGHHQTEFVLATTDEIKSLKNPIIAKTDSGNESMGDQLKEDIIKYLHDWNAKGYLEDSDIINYLIQICQESLLFQQKLFIGMEKRHFCTYKHLNDIDVNLDHSNEDNHHQHYHHQSYHNHQNQENLIKETKRQYDAIDRALDILYNLRDLIEDYPALGQLQKELEEINFNTAAFTNLPHLIFQQSNLMVPGSIGRNMMATASSLNTLTSSNVDESNCSSNYFSCNDDISLNNYINLDHYYDASMASTKAPPSSSLTQTAPPLLTVTICNNNNNYNNNNNDENDNNKHADTNFKNTFEESNDYNANNSIQHDQDDHLDDIEEEDEKKDDEIDEEYER